MVRSSRGQHGEGPDKRTALVRKNILFSFLIKGWSGLVYMLIVPATLHCLGEYRNGVWLTLSSMLIWIDSMDIGLGNGLRNRLAEHMAHGDLQAARKAVASTFAMLIVIMLPIAAVLLALVGASDLYGFLNVEPAQVQHLKAVVAVALLFVCTTFVFKFIGNFYMGLQLPAVNNLLAAGGNTLALAGTCALWLAGSHSMMAVVVVNTSAPLLTYLIAYPYTFLRRYPHLAPARRFVDLAIVRDVLQVGVQFFVIHICSALLMMSANILISRLFSPVHVTPYQIVHRYFVPVLVLFTIVTTPYWSATTDAYQRGDMEWVRRARRRTGRVQLLLTALAAAMVACSPWVYHIWIGDMVHIPFSLTLLMAVYILVVITSMGYSYFLNGLGLLRLQLICAVGAVLLFLALAAIGRSYIRNTTALLIVFILVQLPALVVNKIQLTKVLRGTAKGLWMR